MLEQRLLVLSSHSRFPLVPCLRSMVARQEQDKFVPQPYPVKANALLTHPARPTWSTRMFICSEGAFSTITAPC